MSGHSEGTDKAPSQLDGPEQIVSAFAEFVRAATWADSRAVLETHPELISERADALVGVLIGIGRQQDPELTGAMVVHRNLLRRCRQLGPDAAFAEVTATFGLPRIAALGQRLHDTLGTSDRVASVDDIAASAAVARLLLDDSGLRDVADAGRAPLLDLAATALYRSYQETTSLADLEAALAAWDEALASALGGSRDRAGLLSNRANGLSDRYDRLGNPADLDTALAHLEEALSLTRGEGQLRARLLSNWAVGLSRRYARGRRLDDLDHALVAWTDALAIAPSDSPDVAAILGNRAKGLVNRYERSGAVIDLNGAVADLDMALSLTSRDTDSRSQLLDGLAIALSTRHSNIGDARDLDRALAAWEEALLITPDGSPERPRMLSNRSNGLEVRYKLRGEWADLHEALSCVETALSMTPATSPARPAILNSWASRLSTRYASTGDMADLDSALAAWEESLSLTPSDSPDQPTIISNWATGLLARYARNGNIGDLDGAVVKMREALALTRPDSPELATRLNNLALGLWTRYGRTKDPDDLDNAITTWNVALSKTPPDHPDRASRLSNIGNGLGDRYARTQDVADLEGALAAWEEALALAPSGSPDRAKFINNRASGLAARFRRNGEFADLDGAVADMHAAVSLTPDDSPDRPTRLNNLAIYLVDRHARLGGIADLEGGVVAFRGACRAGLDLRPEASLAAARAWSRWAAERTAWSEVVEAGSYGLDAADRLVRIQSVRTDKESRLRDAQGLASLTAAGWAKLGDGKKAVIAAERGRAVLLAEALTVRATLERLTTSGHDDLRKAYEWAAVRLAGPSVLSRSGELRPGLPGPDTRLQFQGDLDAAITAIRAVPEFEGFLVQPSDEEVFTQVVASASEGALVYVMAAAPGGMILTVQRDGTVGITELPELSESALSEKVSTYFEAYGSFRAGHGMPGWLAVLDETTRWLWACVGGPLSAALQDVGIKRATLVPMGALGLLPLHAAWVEDTSREIGRRYLLDDVCISYAPNAQSLTAARAAFKGEVDSILAVDEPWPVLGSPLLGSELEVATAIASFPGKATVLRHHNATRQAVLESLAGHAVIHLSCHGVALADRPLESQLLMAFDEPITLADLLDSRLDGTRLLVLSACETALPGAQLIDEVVSLPTGLLQAGAAAAIGSLWSVEDLATMALLCRFYQLWRNQSEAPAEALRQAQYWVRDLTPEARAATFPDVDFTGSGESGPRPYANPFWWAAFGLTGA